MIYMCNIWYQRSHFYAPQNFNYCYYYCKYNYDYYKVNDTEKGIIYGTTFKWNIFEFIKHENAVLLSSIQVGQGIGHLITSNVNTSVNLMYIDVARNSVTLYCKMAVPS